MSKEPEVVSTEVAEVKETAVVSKNEGALFDKNCWALANNLSKSDIVPQAYQGKPMNCLIAIEQAQRMHCSPLMVMQNLYIVKGKPNWSGSACSMIVNGCGLFENVDLVYVGKEGEDSYGAYVQATRKSDGKLIKGTTIDMKMVKSEGWLSNPKWKNMPQQMLGYRAYTFLQGCIVLMPYLDLAQKVS